MVYKSLTIKVVGLLLFVLFGLFSTMGLFSIESERQVLGELLERHGKSTARAIAIFSIEAMLSEDFPVLKTFLETTGREEEEILSIQIIQNGMIISEYHHPNASETNQEIFSADIVFTSSENISQKLGEVLLGLSNTYNQKIIKDRIWQLM